MAATKLEVVILFFLGEVERQIVRGSGLSAG